MYLVSCRMKKKQSLTDINKMVCLKSFILSINIIIKNGQQLQNSNTPIYFKILLIN